MTPLVIQIKRENKKGSWERQNLISRIFQLAAIVGLVLAVLFAAAATPFAEGQTYREQVLYRFQGGRTGEYPGGKIIRDAAGNFYGVAGGGRPYDSAGIIFRLSADGSKFNVVYSFHHEGADGEGPVGVIRDVAGNLYGVTGSGGALGLGTVFKVDVSGKYAVLYSFAGGADGANPAAPLRRDAVGNLYGVTINGGGSVNCPGGCGTIFKLDATGKETVLHSFDGNPDGAHPTSDLIQDSTGNLYGTTYQGGTFFSGTVFKLDISDTETVLYSFTDGADGGVPSGHLVRDEAGNLYGTTADGGVSFRSGTVFKLDLSGNETVLHAFTVPYAGPTGGLTRDAAGNLYGTTSGGGAFDSGTVFKLDITGNYSEIYTFVGGRDGRFPYALLIQDPGGNLYGTTSRGGFGDLGTVFELMPQ